MRMGRDKALIEIDGLPMITRVVNALVEAGKEPIRIAVANPEKMEVYATVIDPNYDIEWVLDSVQYAGPVDAIIENLNDPFALKEEFIQLARSVYTVNDKRSEVKKIINFITGSELVEEKSYGEHEES